MNIGRKAFEERLTEAKHENGGARLGSRRRKASFRKRMHRWPLPGTEEAEPDDDIEAGAGVGVSREPTALSREATSVEADVSTTHL